MSGSLENYLGDVARRQSGFRLHLWETEAGWQANVSEPGVNAWACVTMDDPVDAVREALRQRACGVSTRIVQAHSEQHDAPRLSGRQVDLEEAIEAAAAVDDFGDL